MLRNVSSAGGLGGVSLQPIASSGGAPADALGEALAGAVDAETAAALMAAATPNASRGLIAGGTWRARLHLLDLLGDNATDDLSTRLEAVRGTLRVLADDRSFQRDVEIPRYYDAAEWLSESGPDFKGYRAVVFGHTHHAKEMAMPATGARYLNTGTWANVMRFPAGLRAEHPHEARRELLDFATKVKNNDLGDYVEFTPTYVRVDLGPDNKMITAELHDYDWKSEKL